MVHFFGIFSPGPQARSAADEAPAKASFFGGRPEDADAESRLSRVERDACYLNGKAPEPDETYEALRRSSRLD
jgi:hypothetical protein